MAKKGDIKPAATGPRSGEAVGVVGHPRRQLRRHPRRVAKLPDTSVDLIYIDPPFNSNRNYEVFWGETKEKRAFEDRHASTQAYIDYMRPRCVQLARTSASSSHQVR